MQNLIFNYLWMFISIPIFTILFYLIIKKGTPKNNPPMTGACVLFILFGIFSICYGVLINKLYVVTGICWFLLGISKLIYDYKIRK